MIYAKLDDLKKYNIPECAVSFLNTLNAQTPAGHYELSDGIFANIDEYKTKEHKDCMLEAHKKYTDIQLLLCGKERIDFTNTDGLNVKVPYDSGRDVMFFELPETLNSIYLKSGNFALFYPEDAHRPQMNFSSVSAAVKKVVVKIPAAGE